MMRRARTPSTAAAGTQTHRSRSVLFIFSCQHKERFHGQAPKDTGLLIQQEIVSQQDCEGWSNTEEYGCRRHTKRRFVVQTKNDEIMSVLSAAQLFGKRYHLRKKEVYTPMNCGHETRAQPSVGLAGTGGADGAAETGGIDGTGGTGGTDGAGRTGPPEAPRLNATTPPQ